MTDVSKVKALAAAINKQSSPKISAYAVAQAAITVAQEADIRKALSQNTTQSADIAKLKVDVAALAKEVELLRGSSGTPRPPTPPEEPPVDPPPDPTFGTSLPSRMPTSSGTQYYVAPSGGSNSNSGTSAGSPWATIQHALNTVSTTGSIINLMNGVHTPAGQIDWSRVGNSSNPVTLRSAPGGTATIDAVRLLVYNDPGTAGGLRVQNITFRNSTDGVKFEKGNHLEIVGCTIHNQSNMGIYVGGASSPANNCQVWDTTIHTVGDGSPSLNQDHGIYYGNTTNSVVANCLIYNIPFGFGIQIYPECHDSFFVNCTIDDFGNNGCPIIIGSDLGGGFVEGNRIHACILTDANSGFGGVLPFDTLSNCISTDCLTQNAGGYTAGTGMTYTNCTTGNPAYINVGSRNYRLGASSAATNKASARPQFTPALDIEGNSRVTADAGCYRA